MQLSIVIGAYIRATNPSPTCKPRYIVLSLSRTHAKLRDTQRKRDTKLTLSRLIRANAAGYYPE